MITNIDRPALLELMANDAQIVDVLPDAEYAAQHIPGAVSIPLRRLDDEAPQKLSRDKPVVVY
ncbi:MAG: rhodanese-like domain-containing protein [Acidimicrobiia bacterium]|nr:rhodanese-like domain-containing protein [Acidimicrobiia bacterium]NNF64466.1 rhodanese-like domain-containing protein [Acidimicrobiia bacterium]